MATAQAPADGGGRPGDPPAPAAPAAGAGAGLPGRLAHGAVYAFSDRAAGTLSTSVGEGDHAANRTGFVVDAGLPADDVAWMDQVHGGDVVHADAPADPAPRCDGILATTPGLAAAVLVADCVPVLMSAPGGVAAAHAGRDGVLAGVAPTTARRLAEATGTTPADLDVVIGPAIGPCCYEVPADMAARVDAAVPGTAATTTWGTPSLDLVAGVRRQLADVGVTRVARDGGCTRCEGEGRWFSHRATTGEEGRPAGRQAGIVVRPGTPEGSAA